MDRNVYERKWLTDLEEMAHKLEEIGRKIRNMNSEEELEIECSDEENQYF